MIVHTDILLSNCLAYFSPYLLGTGAVSLCFWNTAGNTGNKNFTLVL